MRPAHKPLTPAQNTDTWPTQESPMPGLATRRGRGAGSGGWGAGRGCWAEPCRTYSMLAQHRACPTPHAPPCSCADMPHTPRCTLLLQHHTHTRKRIPKQLIINQAQPVCGATRAHHPSPQPCTQLVGPQRPAPATCPGPQGQKARPTQWSGGGAVPWWPCNALHPSLDRQLPTSCSPAAHARHPPAAAAGGAAGCSRLGPSRTCSGHARLLALLRPRPPSCQPCPCGR
jgi:hypothetical protein